MILKWHRRARQDLVKVRAYIASRIQRRRPRSPSASLRPWRNCLTTPRSAVLGG